MPNRNTQTDGAKQKRKKKPAPERPQDQASAGKKWDVIDEAAWQTFPASDAPTGWAGRDIAPQDRDKKDDPKSSS